MDCHYHLSPSSGIMHKSQILLRKMVQSEKDKPSKKGMRITCLGPWPKCGGLQLEAFVHVFLLLSIFHIIKPEYRNVVSLS